MRLATAKPTLDRTPSVERITMRHRGLSLCVRSSAAPCVGRSSGGLQAPRPVAHQLADVCRGSVADLRGRCCAEGRQRGVASLSRSGGGMRFGVKAERPRIETGLTIPPTSGYHRR
jgi:hypothetical protein